MNEKRDRRGFLQTSVAAGAALTLTGTTLSHADTPTAPATPAAPAAPQPNPRVRPGRVTWHADFAAACAASRTSGKPVLLFQMMGRLDQKLC